MASTESQTASPNKAMNGSTPATKGARGFEGRLREVAALYTDWTIEEESVTREWHRLFADLEPEARQWLASFNRPLTAEERETGELARAPVRETRDALRAALLVRNYRIRGHFAADLDPLKIAGGAGGTPHPDLDPETYGFEASDHERPIFLGGVLGFSWGTLGDLLARLRTVYCGTIGAEFMHIQDPVQRHWWYTKLEHREKFMPDGREQKAVLESLIRAEEFEQFLNRRFAGTKRFGLDGAESVIPATEQILRYAARAGVEQAVIGMPHRGRLNVLAHVMEKPYVAIFSEFSGGTEILEGSGDVKYHLGTSTDRTFDGKRMHLSLAANPSHLEAVNPVVLGKCRAKQRQLSDTSRTRVLPILFHGDAAFAGQGLVAETLDFSDLGGYRVGGIPFTSLSIIKLALPPILLIRARVRIVRILPRQRNRRFCMSMAMILKRCLLPPAWRWNIGKGFTVMWSWIFFVIAVLVITKLMNRLSPNRRCTRRLASTQACPKFMPRVWKKNRPWHKGEQKKSARPCAPRWKAI